MQSIAADCVDHTGEVISGKQKVLADRKRDNRTSFCSNATLDLVALGIYLTHSINCLVDSCNSVSLDFVDTRKSRQ